MLQRRSYSVTRFCIATVLPSGIRTLKLYLVGMHQIPKFWK